MEAVFVEERPVEGAERRVGPGNTVGRAEADFPLPFSVSAYYRIKDEG